MSLLPKTKPSGAFLTMMKVKQRLTIRLPKREGSQSKIKEQQWADFDLFNYLLSSSCVCFRADPPHPIWADPPHCLPIGVYHVQYFPIQLINITHCTIIMKINQMSPHAPMIFIGQLTLVIYFYWSFGRKFLCIPIYQCWQVPHLQCKT
jgi:hypothetical protein